jgi:predicted DNA-binding protein
MPRPVPPEGRWTERHKLVSFYASDELRAWLDAEVKRTGRTKTQVIVEALARLRSADSD